ncbi:MAG: hypothetical protein L0I76_21760 [Pseudonocardia sp.]|nr:hypothetical protein [Pseudonocardia sp.]
MDASNHLSGGDADASSRHSLNRPVAVPDPQPDRGDRGSGAWFAVVLRGYDRAQVDARLAEQDRRISDEARRADAAEAALGAARSRMRRPQDGANAAPVADERSFGLRVERVLQSAEREAADLRDKAAAEAAALLGSARSEAATLLSTARSEAEQRRRQTEQALLGRAATLDAEFTSRAAALDARQREVDDRIATADREAERIREEAERAAADERAGAERRAADLMRHAEEAVREQRADASHDVDRLSVLRDEVRAELSRLRGVLGSELDREPVTPALDEDPLGRSGHDTVGSDAGTAQDAEGEDPLTGKLRIAPAPDTADDDDDDPNERTTIGTIPPITVAPIGVLPFRDRPVGTVGNGRSVTASGDAVAQGPSEDDGATSANGASGSGSGARTSGARTSDDDGSTNGSATRSTSPSRGPR